MASLSILRHPQPLIEFSKSRSSSVIDTFQSLQHQSFAMPREYILINDA